MKLIGKSPPDTVQVTETVSSVFIGSTLNANGAIFGGTDDKGTRRNYAKKIDYNQV